MKKIYDVKVLVWKAMLDGENAPLDGEKLYAIAEPDNGKDSNAVAVYKGKKHIGYLANSKATITDSKEDAIFKTATEVRSFFKAKREITLERDIEHSRGMVFYHSTFEVDDKKKSKKVEEVTSESFEFSLVGGATVHPGKAELMSDIKDGKDCIIKLDITNDSISGIYKGNSAGIVKEDEIKNEIRNMLKNPGAKSIVKAVKVNRATVVCSLEIFNAIVKSTLSIEKIVEKIIEDGIDTKESIDGKLAYLDANGVPKITIEGIFKSYIKYPAHIAAMIPVPKVLYVDTKEKLVHNSAAYMNVNKNLLYEGDRGVGKNVLTETMAWLYNRPLYEFSLNSQQSNNALLGNKTFKNKDTKPTSGLLNGFFSLVKVGTKTAFTRKKDDLSFEDLLSADDAKGAEEMLSIFLADKQKDIVFEKSSIVDAFEYGGVLVLDEFNTALAHVMPVFNSLLDDRRRMNVPDYGMVKGHKNFVAIATQNIDYQGTFESNEATVDRFVPLAFPEDVNLSDILRRRVVDVDEGVLDLVERIYEGIKDAVKRGEVDEKAISIRGFIDACEVLQQEIPLKSALITNVANKAKDKISKKIITDMINLQIGDDY